MFSLVSGLWKYMFKRDEYYILVIGLDNAGKTTLLEQFKKIHRPAYKGIPLQKITPTVGLNVGRVDVDRVRLTLWDLGGQKELQSLWKQYYKDCHGIMFVVDSADRERLEDARATFDAVLRNAELEGVPMIVLCNKQDDETAVQLVRLARGVFQFQHWSVEMYINMPLLPKCMRQNALSVAEIKEMFNQSAPKIGIRDCKVQAVSALRGEHLSDALSWMAVCVQRNLGRPPVSA